MHPKHVSLVLAAAFVAIPVVSQAQTQVGTARTFGLGVVVGFPSVGLSANFFVNPHNSVQIGATWSYRNDDRYVGIRADYLFWMPTLATGSYGEIRWYFGPGIVTGIVNGLYRGGRTLARSNGWFLGAELPIGIGVRFRAVPIDLMAEVVPVLHLFDDQGAYAGLDVVGALHARIYF
jgi:hypothetical protein